jgi:hypothetical protein
MVGKTSTYKCKCCSKPFEARTADRVRGWALFCSKSCKAIKQTKAQTKRTRHDGVSPMKYKKCDTCGDPAINGVYINDTIVWGCLNHHDTTHLFDTDY